MAASAFRISAGLLRYIKPPAGADLIHANTWSGFAFARKDIPLVVTAFHCVCRNGYPLWKALVQSLHHDYWIGEFERSSFALASAVVAMTASAMKYFSDRFDMSAISAIHGWVGASVFKPSENSASRSDPFRILMVSNGSKRKGAHLLPTLHNKLDDRLSITVVGGAWCQLEVGLPRSDIQIGVVSGRTRA